MAHLLPKHPPDNRPEREPPQRPRQRGRSPCGGNPASPRYGVEEEGLQPPETAAAQRLRAAASPEARVPIPFPRREDDYDTTACRSSDYRDCLGLALRHIALSETHQADGGNIRRAEAPRRRPSSGPAQRPLLQLLATWPQSPGVPSTSTAWVLHQLRTARGRSRELPPVRRASPGQAAGVGGSRPPESRGKWRAGLCAFAHT